MDKVANFVNGKRVDGRDGATTPLVDPCTGEAYGEAARSTGLTWWQTMAHVVVPQATRNVLPDLISNTLEVVKLTTLASVVAIPELLNAARNAQALTYNPTPIVLAALIYLVALWPIVRLISRLEHKAVAVR